MFELLVSAGLFLLLDQGSKGIVRSRALHPGVSFGVLQIHYVPHRSAFYQRAAARAFLAVLWPAALASAVFLNRSGMWFHSTPSMIGMGCALGGAAGNLMDILRRKYVADFIDLGWWPVFNVADVGIIGGLALAFWP
ncbi:MAG TPA: signal peptidase II [Terriglobales bacterium]|nr:signal peptidase II [Terriglobales bacterium]